MLYTHHDMLLQKLAGHRRPFLQSGLGFLKTAHTATRQHTLPTGRADQIGIGLERHAPYLDAAGVALGLSRFEGIGQHVLAHTQPRSE